MIQQIVLPYIIIDKFPNTLINFNYIINQTNIVTQYYLDNVQNKHILDVLKKCENKLLTLLLNIINKYEGYSEINNKYFEYLEILNIQWTDMKNDSEIMIYNNNQRYNILCVINNMCKFNKKNYLIKDNQMNLSHEETISYIQQDNIKTTDLIFFDLSEVNREYQNNELLLNLPCMLNELKINGNMIICLEDTYSTVMIDVIYLLNGIFKKLYISRPLIMNIHNKYRYIICKNLQLNINKNELINLYNFFYKKIHVFKNTENVLTNKNKIFEVNIPIFFKQKLNDINCIYGQQILENTMLFVNNKYHEISGYYKNLMNIIEDWIELHKIYLPINTVDININNEINELLKKIVNHVEEKNVTDES